ncbi:MAG: hypothetical protein KC466_12515, partial [Myxococcales bacterium]|nr:hypothetical protein [Myxococcales bacterium]
ADSHAEDQVLMKYMNTSKVDTSYEGTEAGIPWADIAYVYGVYWFKDGAYLEERSPRFIIDAVDEKVGTVDLIVLKL